MKGFEEMGLVFQVQRRAIEDLRHEAEATPITNIENEDYISTSTGQQLYIAGISPGIGTCSDIHGVDVLVLAEVPPIERRELGRLACAYTVLVRNLAEQKAKEDSVAQIDRARPCVEL